MIAIIDYGMGNLRSVQKALHAVGADARITSDSRAIYDAGSVVLPGVGAFRDCMENLRQLDLLKPIQKTIQSGKPFLGICLGLQILFSQSEEFGLISGLDIIPGKVARFALGLRDPQSGGELKIPHMGWNRVRYKRTLSLFDGIPDDSWFYFVHSYCVRPEDPEYVVSTTHYGAEFVSGIQHQNIHAIQFHPEKSQTLGLVLMKNFSRLK
ncbi:MAG: imidazole glycerol phosphate synthase subunit HisH [Nitrospinota bacterium]|nr:imidazole glycerol phosphate synthase subunit HisH [Nitrospinota bacterium]